MQRSIFPVIVAMFITGHLHLFAQQSWTVQECPIDTDLIGVTFPDSTHGWIAAENGTILTTTNSGRAWNVLKQIEGIIPSDIVFLDTLNGWMTGRYDYAADSAFIMQTEDGGNTWNPVFQAMFYRLNDIYVMNKDTAWVAGAEISETDTVSVMLYTNSGGFSWAMPSGPRIKAILNSIHFRNSEYGDAGGEDGIFFSTQNGGMDPNVGWSTNVAIPGYGKDLNGIYNAGSTYGVAVGQDGFVLFTKDNWTNHQDLATSSGDDLHATAGSSSGQKYWTVGKNGCIATVTYAVYMTVVDEESRITEHDLNDLSLVDEYHIWAVGDKGTILAFLEVNHPPVAEDDEVRVRQDSTVSILVLANDHDEDGDLLRVDSYTDGAHGKVELQTNMLIYDPDDEYDGMDTVRYTITDDISGTDDARVFIEVTPVPITGLSPEVGPEHEEWLTIYPNPAQSALQLEIQSFENRSEEVELILLSTSGRRVLTRKVMLKPGSNSLSIPLPVQGAYILRVIRGGEAASRQVIRVL